MATEDYLLHPELLCSLPFVNSLTATLLRRRIREVADDPDNDPPLSMVVRVFNEATKLEQLFEDLDRQRYSSAVEVVVVDNGSSDMSAQVAKSYGAVVVVQPQSSFSYPKSLNLGINAASHDLVFVTVAHARLSNVHNLHAGARHFRENSNVGGAFSTTLPSDSASYVEKWTAVANNNWLLARPARRINKAGMGVLGATGAMIAKPVWRELGRFDISYQAGGEDTALAGSMMDHGYGIVYEPALAVHHSHGLGLRDFAKQWAHWQQASKGPQQLDRHELLGRRPDLRDNYRALDP
jgi:glycosyltransferase involved in cell wall biosynthesis